MSEVEQKARQLCISNESDVMLGLANRIVGNASPDEDSRLEVAYAIARHLGLSWPAAKRDANACLIAATSKLYEALVMAEEKLCIAEKLLGLGQDDSPDFEPAILTARAALAKARGES